MISLLIWSATVFASSPFECDEALAHFTARTQPAAARDRVAANFARGLSTPTAVAFAPANVIEMDALARTYAEPEFSVELAMTQPFAARFLAFPVTHVNFTLTEWTGIPDDARVFAMHLRPAEVDKHLGGTVNRGFDARVPEAFAYLRYHRRGDDFVVTEIRSEVFSTLADPRARQRYAGWDAALIYAFERFADAISTDHRWRVVISGLDFQRRRNVEHDERTARRLYHGLPQILGYHSTTEHLAPEVNGAIGLAPVKIGAAFAIALGDQPGYRVGRAQAYQNLTLTTRNRLEAARAELAKRLPRTTSSDPVVAPAGPVAEVKFTPYPVAQLYQYKAQRTLHEKLIKTVPPWAREFTKTTLISLARAGRDETVRTPVTWQRRVVDFTHEPGHERHGSVRLAEYPGVVTLKGVGRRTLDDDLGLADQVFAPRLEGMMSHLVWGGLPDGAGVLEFRQHLHLWALGERAGVKPSIAVPLGLGYAEQMPRVNGHERALVHVDDYLENELRDAPERLVVARYFAHSNHRAGVVPTLLDAPDIARAAAPFLRETYEVFNENLDLPPDPPPREGEIDHAYAGRYLKAVASANGGAPARILRRWAERTLATIGLVHGAGGHLGGTLKTQATSSRELGDAIELGAPGGGATAKRNVTLAGELRDLDENVYLPTNPARAWGQPRPPSSTDLDRLQREDLRHWAESYYWMSVLLCGLDEPPTGLRLPGRILTETGELNLEQVETTDDEREAYAFRELGRALTVDTTSSNRVVFQSKDLGDAYAHARERAERAGP